MTGLLVSVRSAEEAAVALASGAHLIDLKEPLRGALGAADPEVCAGVTKIVGTSRPLSAALGELLHHRPNQGWKHLRGYTYAKFGLAGCAKASGWATRWRDAVRALPPALSAVAVVYADYQIAEAPPPDDILEVATSVGCRAMLIDTFDKSRGDVFLSLDEAELARLLASARRRGLITVLAGSIELGSLQQALALKPDYVGVRGAVCNEGRESSLSGELVTSWVAELA